MKLSKKRIETVAGKLRDVLLEGTPKVSWRDTVFKADWCRVATFVLTEFPTTPKAPRWPKSTAKPIKSCRVVRGKQVCK